MCESASTRSALFRKHTLASYFLSGVAAFFAIPAFAAQVTLAWEPSASAEATGYYIYYGQGSRSYCEKRDAGNNTSYTVGELQAGVTYYFSATAHNAEGVESGFSNEVSTIVDGEYVPEYGYNDSRQVVEFYNPDLDHYFITADAEEQAFVDTGAVGHWQRTGNTFGAGGLTPVCRFYGNTVVNPESGWPYGPNSHFYTASVNECAFLNAISDPNAMSWKCESLDFATTPATGGFCPDGLVPVYRAYNNGFDRGIDSNHRITSNLDSIREVEARGWIYEGVVMCAPQ